jgi:methylenetetrahydrofolate dehydrogenase (NADP+)/methenyltetrahydrofolate cyclohydrolase
MIVDGRALAQQVLLQTKARAERFGRPPRVIAYVSEDPTPATRSYLQIKKRSAEAAGCVFEESSSESRLLEGDAAIVQLPTTPEAMHLLDQIPLGKDADVLSKVGREKFEKGDADALLPPVASAIKKILESAHIKIRGKKAVCIGAGFLVGAPAATWLKQQGAEVEVVTLESGDMSAALRAADIIVSGAGSPHFIKPDMLKEGVVLIDAGASEQGGILVGDADPACAAKCSLFTPVPGGVGPLAVACLFDNVVTLAERTTNS